MAECACNSAVKIIYSCSGAADVGEASDRTARQLRREGFAGGSCTAALAAGFSGYVQSALGADVNIAVDGCSNACSRKILQGYGINPVSYIVTDFGFEKGKTVVDSDTIDTLCENIRNGKNQAEGGCISELPSGCSSCGSCGCGNDKIQ